MAVSTNRRQEYKPQCTIVPILDTRERRTFFGSPYMSSRNKLTLNPKPRLRNSAFLQDGKEGP